MSKNVFLCVDDEKIILDSIKAQLKEKYGNTFHYETAESASEAMEIIDELMEDDEVRLIIITDWLMPVMKGDEFLVNVHRKYPRVLNIMLTGQADMESVERTKQEANLFKCIRKPWVQSELLSTIDSGLCLI